VSVPIAALCRSPFTRAQGALAGWHPVDLAAEVMNETLRRADLDPDDIDEIWVGCAEPVGAQGANMARAAVLTAGWPDRIGGAVIDRAETSGAAALHAAAAAIHAGTIRSALVLGVSASSTVPPGAAALGRTYGRPWGTGPAQRTEHAGGLTPAPVAADHAAARSGIGRAEQEGWSRRSHERRGDADPSTLVSIAARPGDRLAVQRGAPVERDEPREMPADASSLPPSFDPEGSVTSFTFSPPADGVAAVLLRVDAASTTPAIAAVGRAAGDPLDPTGGLDRAAVLACAGLGCDPADLDRWELVEPTAAAALVAIERLRVPPDRVNVDGGTLGVGDAAAADELRLIVDAVASNRTPALVGCASFGPTGAAVTILRCP